MKDFYLVFISIPSKNNKSVQKHLSSSTRCQGYTSRFGIPVRGQYDFFTGCFCKTAVTGEGFVNHSGTDLHIYFYPCPQNTHLSSFILVDVCILGSSG